MTSTVVPGAIAGGVALLVFVVLHAIWILPIWAMLSMLPIAALIGALAAWPFQEITTRGWLAAPLDGLAFAALLLATLVPTALVGVFAGPIDRYHINAGLLLFSLGLAAPAGAAIGLLLTGSPSGAAALGLAGLALALTLGHNLPFFPVGSPGWEKAFALVAVAEVTAGIAFGLARAVGAFPLPDVAIR